jgi:hypothetical protein
MPKDIEALRRAAEGIAPECLEKAKEAIRLRCQEYLEQVPAMVEALERAEPARLGKLARALALLQLGSLPVRPETCPFCLQYGGDRSCTGCGYAATHGRCDDPDSAFSRFIEAYQELGQGIFQDRAEEIAVPPGTKEILLDALEGSVAAVEEMLGDLPWVGAYELMALKKGYLRKRIFLVYVEGMDQRIKEDKKDLLQKLERYW